jgi:hypothetical protein
MLRKEGGNNMVHDWRRNWDLIFEKRIQCLTIEKQTRQEIAGMK